MTRLAYAKNKQLQTAPTVDDVRTKFMRYKDIKTAAHRVVALYGQLAKLDREYAETQENVQANKMDLEKEKRALLKRHEIMQKLPVLNRKIAEQRYKTLVSIASLTELLDFERYVEKKADRLLEKNNLADLLLNLGFWTAVTVGVTFIYDAIKFFSDFKYAAVSAGAGAVFGFVMWMKDCIEEDRKMNPDGLYNKLTEEMLELRRLYKQRKATENERLQARNRILQ